MYGIYKDEKELKAALESHIGQSIVKMTITPHIMNTEGRFDSPNQYQEMPASANQDVKTIYFGRINGTLDLRKDAQGTPVAPTHKSAVKSGDGNEWFQLTPTNYDHTSGLDCMIVDFQNVFFYYWQSYHAQNTTPETRLQFHGWKIQLH